MCYAEGILFMTVDNENKILQNCELEESDTQHSDCESHSDPHTQKLIKMKLVMSRF
jgi:hypothetical protein